MPHAEATPESRSADMSPAVRSYHEKLYQELMALIRTLGCERLVDVHDLYKPHTKEGALRIAHDTTLTQQFTRLDELTRHLEAIRKNPQDIGPLPLELRREVELRLLFKDSFFGIPEIETAFTLKDGTSAIDFTEEEKDEAKQMLLDKLAEPDIAHFIEYLKEHPEEAKNWLLVYRPRAQMRSSLEDGAPMVPISILPIRNTLDADARSAADPINLISREMSLDPLTYCYDIAEGDAEPWVGKPLTQGWQFVTREVVMGTPGKGKSHTEQTAILAEEAKRLGFREHSWRRRTPQEVVFDVIVAWKATRTQLISWYNDWTDQKTTTGGIVSIAGIGYEYGIRDGVRFREKSSRGIDGNDGVCLSR